MANDPFPRTTIGGLSVSRLVIGTNWMNGFSHRTPAQDRNIRELNHRHPDNIADILEVFLDAGVDTILGGIGQVVLKGIRAAEDRTGRKIHIINTPRFDVADTREGRQDAERAFRATRDMGAEFCFPFHGMVEQLVDKESRTIRRLPDYLAMIRDLGMIPGLSAHMPEVILYSDEQGYDVESYLQIYNAQGFLMQLEIETVNRIIWNAKKPVLTFKPMAAGRMTPFVGLNFVWNTIRDRDLVAAGCMTPDEAAEVVEISRAAIDRRQVDIRERGSISAMPLDW